MWNNLFNQSLLKKYAKKFKITHRQKETILKYLSKLENNEFEGETRNYINFFDMILKDVLGYNRENIDYDSKVDDGSSRVEFALKSKDKNRFMVVELKGQKVDLDKKQSRQGDTRTPVDQAFGYAIHMGEVEWMLVSNYDEFRIYNYHHKTKHISFKASDLKDDKKLKCFLLLLSKESHLEKDYIKRIQKESLGIERKLEKNFYKLYHETRLMILKELEEKNGLDRLKAVHYAQLILNRYMFICFAENIGLLPPQISTKTISTPIKNHRLRDKRIWQELNDLFLDINDGRNYHYNDVYGYNGGLFDEDLDFIEIRDTWEEQDLFKDTYQKYDIEEYRKPIGPLLEPYGKKVNPIYRNLLTISSFDFSTDLDVNILGHIFENSIGDIEELKADSKGRRKKEGVFYTPEHITDYICRNTIIPYLSKTGKINTTLELINEYKDSIDELDQKLKDIKIVDPACGSGAFLNKAADVLLEIHDTIHKCKYKEDKTLMPYFDSVSKRREILLDNIYGVDLNEESVEITKLAFFLKVAKNKIKLPNLDNNIKCGNSLVDDPEYTDKPFNWEEEFKTIFDKGGFDIVIGNPPYVRQEKIKEIKPYLKDKYMVYTGVADLYTYFFEKGLRIVKEKGILSFISSNKFIKSNYGKKLRNFLIKNHSFVSYVDHTYSGIFEDATTYPGVFIFKKQLNNKNKIFVNNDFELEQSRLNDEEWSFEKPEALDLKEKILSVGYRLGDLNGVDISYGIKTGYNKAFVIDEYTKNLLIEKDSKSTELIKPLLTGRDIKKWRFDFKNIYLIFTRRGIDIDSYPAIKEYLLQFKDRLTPKKGGRQIGRKPGPYEWYEIQDAVDYYKKFEENKLIYPNLASSLFVAFDNQNYYTNQKCFIITSIDQDLKFLGALLSSKVLNFVFKFSGTPLQGHYYDLNKKYIEKLPICTGNQIKYKSITEKADLMLKLNKDLWDEINGFKEWVKHTFHLEKFSKKLDEYYKLSFEDLLSELKKKKVDVQSRKNHDLLKAEFEESINKIHSYLHKIEKTDKEIDHMVYELYGLTDDEIKIVEDTCISTRV